VNLPLQLLADIEPDAPTPPKRRFSSSFAFVGVVVVGALVLVLCVLGTTMSGLFNFTSSTDTTAAGASPDTSGNSVKGPVKTSFDDGQWLIAVDIQSGTYATTVPADAAACTWERNASSDGTSSSVLESGGGKPGEALVVAIKPTDKVFQSNGCGTWQRTGDVEPSKDTSYTDNNGGGTND
jgi:hypothetical protein